MSLCCYPISHPPPTQIPFRFHLPPSKILYSPFLFLNGWHLPHQLLFLFSWASRAWLNNYGQQIFLFRAPQQNKIKYSGPTFTFYPYYSIQLLKLNFFRAPCFLKVGPTSHSMPLLPTSKDVWRSRRVKVIETGRKTKQNKSKNVW